MRCSSFRTRLSRSLTKRSAWAVRLSSSEASRATCRKRIWAGALLCFDCMYLQEQVIHAFEFSRQKQRLYFHFSPCQTSRRTHVGTVLFETCVPWWQKTNNQTGAFTLLENVFSPPTEARVPPLEPLVGRTRPCSHSPVTGGQRAHE